MSFLRRLFKRPLDAKKLRSDGVIPLEPVGNMYSDIPGQKFLYPELFDRSEIAEPKREKITRVEFV